MSNNMEIIQGIVEAAQEEKAPLILQVSAGARKYAKPAYLIQLVEAAILDTGLDIALDPDHGEDFDIWQKMRRRWIRHPLRSELDPNIHLKKI